MPCHDSDILPQSFLAVEVLSVTSASVRSIPGGQPRARIWTVGIRCGTTAEVSAEQAGSVGSTNPYFHADQRETVGYRALRSAKVSCHLPKFLPLFN